MAANTTALRSSMTVYAVRLRPGQEIKSQLLHIRQQHNLSGCFVLSCVGSVTKATLRLAKPPDDRERIVTYDEYFEIVSLVGTVSQDGDHLHVALGRYDGSTISGHLIEMTVYTTAEIMLGNLAELKFTRTVDPETTWDELVIEEI